MARQDKRVALLLGNRSYRHSSFNQLTAPQDDVIRLSKVLRNRDICDFDEVRLKLDASLVDAKLEIGWLLHDRHPDDLVLLYFSGHGVKDLYGTFYLALTETDPENPDPGSIDEYWLRRVLENCRSERQVVILDACYSGGLIPENLVARDGGAGPILTERALQSVGRGRYILTATTAESHAFERDGQSLYTHEIVECLSFGVPDSDDEYTSVNDLHRFLKKKIAKTAPPTMQPQLWRGASKEPEPLILAKNLGYQSAISNEVRSGLFADDAKEIELAVFRLEHRLNSEKKGNSQAVPVLREALSKNKAISFTIGTRISRMIDNLENEIGGDETSTKKLASDYSIAAQEPEEQQVPTVEAEQSDTLLADRALFRSLLKARQFQLLVVASAMAFMSYVYLATQVGKSGEELVLLAKGPSASLRPAITRAVIETDVPPPVPAVGLVELLPLILGAAPKETSAILTGREDASLVVVELQANQPALFFSARAELDPSYLPLISAIAGVIIDNQDFIGGVTVIGHTDSIPVQRSNPFQTNQGLSEARAENVAVEFLASGVPEDIIKFEGRGSTDPVASNDTIEGRARNRRIVVVVEKRI